jgi:hypothetical protein
MPTVPLEDYIRELTGNPKKRGKLIEWSINIWVVPTNQCRWQYLSIFDIVQRQTLQHLWHEPRTNQP